MPRKSLQSSGHIDEIMNAVITLIEFSELRIHLQCLIDGNAQFIRNHLCHAVTYSIRQIQHTSHIADNTSCCHGTESNNLYDTLLAVFADDIINDFLTSLEAEVHVNIRHGDAVRVQKALKEQIITNRIQCGNIQAVRHDTSCCGASPRSHHNVMLLGVMNEIPYNQEIIHKSHGLNGIQLIADTLFKLLICLWISFIKTVPDKLLKIPPRIVPFRYRKFRQFIMAKLDIHIASHGNFVRVFNGFSGIREKCCHLFRGFDIILTAFIAHTVCVRYFLACLDTQKDIMGLGILC